MLTKRMNLENKLNNRTHNPSIKRWANGSAYEVKPKVQLIYLALHAILTLSGKTWSKLQLKGIWPRYEDGIKNLNPTIK